MTDREDKIIKEIAEIEKLAKENKGIDANALIRNVLERNREQTKIPQGQKIRAYLVSVFLPPFGLYYVFKYFGSTEPGGKRLAVICLVLTTVSMLITFSLAGSIFASLGGEDFQNFSPSQYQDLIQ